MRDLAAAIERDFVAGTTTLGEVGAFIDARSWLAPGDVALVSAVTGKLPVAWQPGGTVATVALWDGAVLYLALNERLSAAEVADGLLGASGAERASAAIVRDAAVHPG